MGFAEKRRDDGRHHWRGCAVDDVDRRLELGDRGRRPSRCQLVFRPPNFIVGAEADFDALSNKGTASFADGSTQAGKTEFVSTACARIGLTADRFLWYVTGGFAWAQNQFTRTQVTGTVNGAGPGTVETLTKDGIGYAVGTGLEYAFASHWTARFEFLAISLGTESFTFPLSARSTTAASETIGQVRFGVNYKFGGGDVVPISVKD